MKSFHTGLQLISPSIWFLPAALIWRTSFRCCAEGFTPSQGSFGGSVPQCAASPSCGWYPVCPWSSWTAKPFWETKVSCGTTFQGRWLCESCFLLRSTVSIRVASASISFASFNLFWPVPTLSPTAPSFHAAWAAPPVPKQMCISLPRWQPASGGGHVLPLLSLLSLFYFLLCSAGDTSEGSAWVQKGTGDQPGTSSCLLAKGFCSDKASIYFTWARCCDFPWCHTWSPLCGPGQGLLASANQRQRGYELLNAIMQGGGSPPEMLWITIPVKRKLMNKMLRTTPCLGLPLSAPAGPRERWWHLAAPQAAGQVILQCWQNGTWQSAIDICVRFVACSAFYRSGDAPDCVARSQGVNGVKGIGRKYLSYSKVRA